MNFYYRKKKNSQYLISGSKLFQFIVTLWNYGEYVLYFQFNTITKYPKRATLQINVWAYTQRGQNSSEIISKIYCGATTAEETWEDLTVLFMAASFLGCLGSFWYRTQQIWNSPVLEVEVLRQGAVSYHSGMTGKYFIPTVVCGLCRYHLLCQVPAFLKYIALERPVSFTTAEIPIFIVLLKKINHHTFFKWKKTKPNLCLLTVFTPSSFECVFHVLRNISVPSLPFYPNLPLDAQTWPLLIRLFSLDRCLPKSVSSVLRNMPEWSVCKLLLTHYLYILLVISYPHLWSRVTFHRDSFCSANMHRAQQQHSQPLRSGGTAC